MNKIIKGGLSILAAGLLAAGCVDQRDTLVCFDPDKVIAPELSDAQSTTLSDGGSDVVLSFESADFGIQSAVRYTLYASATSDFEKADVIAATIGNKTATLTQKSLNSFILNLGGSPEQEFTLYFRLHASMSNDQNTPVPGTEVTSNVAKGVFIPYSMLVSDKDTYGYIYVIGDYCSWGHADPKLQNLFNYSKDGNTYSGVVDFGGKAANGFKLTGGPDWDHGNWGIDGKATAPGSEATTVSLIDDGGSGNITCYSKRFYLFSFDKSNLTLTRQYGFDQMGLIGFNGDWDNDIVMEYNPGYSRFYVDVEATGATEFKFRLDGGWDINWGDNGDGPALGGKNIPLSAGNYRIYFNLNKLEYEISASMYGQPEPGLPEVAPEPVKPSIWSLAGSFNGWSPTDESTNLTNLSGDTWVLRNYEFQAGAEFKIVADHDWANENYGGPEANSSSTLDPGNVYPVYAPEMGVKFELGGTNIQIPEAGKYDITFDYASKTMVVSKHVSGFSLIGMINGDSWTTDVMMTQDGDIWTSPVVTISGGFKIRYDFSWDDANTYGAPSADFVATAGTPFTAVQPGSDIKLAEAGDYKVIFNAATKEVTINAVAFPETLYMIGDEFGGWDWTSDGIVDLVPVYNQDDKAQGQFWTVRYITAGKGFKFCSKKAWQNDFCGLDTNEGFQQSSGNCVVEADGFYMIHIDLKRSILHVEPARIYGIGSCFGGWDAGMENALFTQDGQTLKATLVADGELRMYAESSIATTDWWTREFIILDGKIAYRGNGGDQDRVNAGAGQVVALDFNAGTGNIQ